MSINWETLAIGTHLEITHRVEYTGTPDYDGDLEFRSPNNGDDIFLKPDDILAARVCHEAEKFPEGTIIADASGDRFLIEGTVRADATEVMFLGPNNPDYAYYSGDRKRWSQLQQPVKVLLPAP